MTSERPGGGPTLATGLGLFATLIAFVIGARVIRDNSLLTHLATGELILDQGSVPTADPYSRTAPGDAWTVQSWLASIVYALIDRTVGPTGLRLLNGVTAALITAGVWRLTAPSRQVVPRLALTLTPLVIGAQMWSPRPFLFGLLAVVALLVVVESGARPLLLVPLFWLWTNTHGSFPLGIALLGALAVGRLLDHRQLNRTEAEDGGLTPWSIQEMPEIRYGLAATAGVVLGAINPVGPRLVWFPIHLLGRRDALAGVVEWQPPSFDNVAELLFLALIALVAVAARFGASWRALLPSLCFLAGGMLAIRNIAMAAIVVVVLVAPSFRDRFGEELGTATGLLPRLLGRAAVVGLAVIAVVVATGPGLDLDAYPVDEIAFLDDRDLVGVDSGLIHREGVGNYLTFRYGPDAGVFIDDRFDYFPVELTDDHLALLHGGDYRAVLDRWAGDVVLWEADSVLADWLRDDEQWTVVRNGDGWVIACRVGSSAHQRCTDS